jgi:hypothetical protein
MAIVLDGNLGITTPAETVQGALTTTGNTILGDATTDTLNVGNGGLVKDASGNVGIGVTPSTYTAFSGVLVIGGVGNSLLAQSGVSAQVDLTNNTVYNSGYKYAISDYATEYVQSQGIHTLRTAPSGTAGNSITWTDQMNVTNAGLLQFNSGYGSAATAYGCRAWVNFNGTGTVAIRASGNVSSITDNGVGFYTVNFTTALVDANYTAVANTAIEGTYAASSACSSTTNTASGAVISVTDYNGPARCDQNGIYINIFR